MRYANLSSKSVFNCYSDLNHLLPFGDLSPLRELISQVYSSMDFTNNILDQQNGESID